MKIVFVTNTLGSGGAERTIAYLSDYLVKKGHDVYIIITSNTIFYQINPKVSIRCLNMQLKGKQAILIRAYRKFKRMILQRRELKNISPDVVFSIQPSNVELVFKLKKKLGFALIVSERSNPAMTDMKIIKRNLKIMPVADGVIFQTERAKLFYPEYVQKKSRIIGNAIGNPDVYIIRKPLERKKTIVSIGRLEKVKDYQTLIKAFSNVHRIHEDYSLEIYGEGSERANLEKTIEELNLSEAVFLLGNREDVIAAVADAACFVLSSKYEGMPNSLMEAMAIGLPCVSTDCPNGPAELIQSGKNGILVPVGDVEAMTLAINKMIEDDKFACLCGRKASEILKTHSVDKKAQEYLDYICEIVRKKDEYEINS